jgi:DNA-binding winged helix-turn-helix (wHTH) protein
MFVRFGDFVFNPGLRSLVKQGKPVHLTPRGFKLLEILVHNRPRPVLKSELTRQLWPDTFVSDGNLPNVVLEVRRALHEAKGAELIRTIHGFGYAFVGDARDEEATAPAMPGMFRVLFEGREIGLWEGENWIGRSLDCVVQVHCPLASRRHARITVAEGHATLEDGASTHGTILNWERISAPTPLHNGDLIRIGSMHLTFVMVRPDAPTDRTPVQPGGHT